MRLFAASLITTAALLAAGCASAPTVRIDKDPTANMSTYKTFAFFDHPSTDRAQYSSLMTARLQHATRAQLEKHGYTYDESSPQLRVNFFVNVRDKQEIRSANVGTGFYRYRFGYNPWAGQGLETVEYKAGTLSVDLVDTKTNALVWHGLAEGRVSSEASQNPSETIDRTVAEIFNHFPQGRSNGNLRSSNAAGACGGGECR